MRQTLQTHYLHYTYNFPPPFSSSTCIIHYATWKDLPGRDRRAGELGVSCGAGTCSSCESWDPFWTSGGMKTPALRLYSLMHTEQWSHTHTTHACAHVHTSADTHNYGVEVASNKLIIPLRAVWNPNKTRVNQGGRAIIFWHQKDEEQIDSLLKLAWGPPANLRCSRKKLKSWRSHRKVDCQKHCEKQSLPLNFVPEKTEALMKSLYHRHVRLKLFFPPLCQAGVLFRASVKINTVCVTAIWQLGSFSSVIFTLTLRSGVEICFLYIYIEIS